MEMVRLACVLLMHFDLECAGFIIFALNIMNKKTILFLLYRECAFLPPFLTILDCLKEEYVLKVISRETPDSLSHLKIQYADSDVSFLATPKGEISSRLKSRISNKIRNTFHIPSQSYKESLCLLKETKYDLLWVIHENTAYEFKDALVGKKYILSLYELNDHRRDFLEAIQPIMKNALEVIAPEYNRACILRVWLNLDKTPTVIPNKPLNHPRKRCIPNPYSAQLEGKKIVLYQGYINRNRNLDAVCEGVKDMPEYSIVLMGKGDESYIQELKNKYPQIIHISFIAPPEHLYVTSWAHIALVKYDFVVLNAIFCAPNKTWEYTGFGIPILGQDIPGLQYTIGQYKAGVCTDMDNIDCIKAAIEEIDQYYEEYSRNAMVYYDSFDIKEAIGAIVKEHTTYE